MYPVISDKVTGFVIMKTVQFLELKISIELTKMTFHEVRFSK